MNRCLSASLGLALAFALPTGGAYAAPEGNELSPLAETVDQVKSLGLGSLSGYYLAARHAGLNNDLSAAASYYTSALAQDPDNTELLDSSVLLNVASGNIAQAAELARRLLESDPSDQVGLITLAVAQLRDGENEAAGETIGKLGDLGGQLQELVSTLMQAWATTADGRAAQAVNMLDDLEGPSWFSAFTTLHAGLIADYAGLSQIGADRLRLAYERDPGAVRVVDAYARLLARSGDTDRALATLASFDERIGGNDHFTAPLRAAIQAGDPIEAQITDPRQGAAEALYGIGSAVGREGGDTFAASLLQLALYLAPDSYFPAMALGQVLEAMDQNEAAIRVYRAIPTEVPMRRNALVQEALNLNILERHEEAIEILSKLVENDPTDVGTAIALGNVYRSLERFSDAAAVYTTSIDAFDEVPQPYWTLFYYRGIANERTDKWTAAEADFRKALELEPEQPLILNYLGYSYIDRGENLDEALDMVQRAVAARPEDGYIVDSLGWAYYRLGRMDDAVRELERAVSLKPGDPVINDHLGDAYWQVGRKLEAMFQWSHARDSDPEPDELVKILKKLREGLPSGSATETAETAPEPALSAPTPPADPAPAPAPAPADAN
ncbi:tetratricopeptide repeat protein [Acuticoccus sp. M5D2P5]|uniref:tetratricopeptide repeat protein n=1 Tax=Acuticoccus kalidii TaxID=2910977 RepID=UPI001F44B397|nr:tetratricopeptide repeat protein [Acuticoccus kalidii]MCF3936088.1 tetratricopeptide repeat protein [Acuticoccus kalidii]